MSVRRKIPMTLAELKTRQVGAELGAPEQVFNQPGVRLHPSWRDPHAASNLHRGYERPEPGAVRRPAHCQRAALRPGDVEEDLHTVCTRSASVLHVASN
jgi:hypothetical protein